MTRTHRLSVQLALGALLLTGCTHQGAANGSRLGPPIAVSSGYDVSKGLEANAAQLTTPMTLLVATYPRSTALNAAVEKASAQVEPLPGLPAHQISATNKQAQAVLATAAGTPALATVFYQPLTAAQLGTVSDALRSSGATSVRSAAAPGYHLALSVPLQPGSPLARRSHSFALVFSPTESSELGQLTGSALGVGRPRPDIATLGYDGLVLPEGALDRMATILATDAGEAPVEVRVTRG